MRLDFGEFQDPGHPEPNWYARNWFLQLANQMAPKVLADLRDHVLPIYRQLDANLQHRPQFVNEALQHGWASLTQTPRGIELSTALHSLTDSMSQWAQSYRLNVDWVLNRALATMHRWLSGTDQNTWQGIDRSGGHSITWDELQYQFVYQGWVTTTWRRRVYEPMIQAAFAAHLKNYMDRVEADAMKRGLIRTAEWRSRDGEIGRRFEQLVRWQVLEWTLNAIARQGKTSIRTVRANLVSSAEEIGLPLRPGLRGRPPKPPRCS